MAKIFGQLEKAQAENTTSDTASHPKGMMTYRTDLNVMKVSNGTTYKAVIDEDTAQTLAAKTLTSPAVNGAITFDQITTPANPAASHNKIYFKADGNPYTLNSSGTELTLGASTAVTPSTKTTTFTFAGGDETILADTTGGDFTGTLPTAVGIGGKEYTLIKTSTDANKCVLATTSGQTVGIRASASIAVRRVGDYVTVKSDGANWVIKAKRETEIQTNQGQTSLSANTAGDFPLHGTIVTLDPGAWEITGSMHINAGSGTAAVLTNASGLFSADGNNTSSTPASLSSGANVKQIDGDPIFTSYASTSAVAATAAGANQRYPAGQVVLTLTVAGGSQTVYMVPQIDYATAGNATATTHIYARRLD